MSDLGFCLRLRTRLAGRRAGLSRDDINTVIDGMDDELIARAKVLSGVKVPDFKDGPVIELPGGGDGTVGAFGDGTVIKQILDWISSPDGQAFIKFIFSLFSFVI